MTTSEKAEMPTVDDEQGRSYIVLADKTVWPRVDDPKEVEWRLRYGTPTREDLLTAASYISAYRSLVAETERRRREVVRALRAVWQVQP